MSIERDIKTTRAINVYQSVLQEQTLKSNLRQEKELSRIKAEIEKSNEFNKILLLKHEKEKEQKILANYLNYQLNKLDLISRIQSDQVRKYFYITIFEDIFSDINENLDRVENIQDKNYINNELSKHHQLSMESRKVIISSDSLKSTLGHFKSYNMMLTLIDNVETDTPRPPSDKKMNEFLEGYKGMRIFGFLALILFTFLLVLSLDNGVDLFYLYLVGMAGITIAIVAFNYKSKYIDFKIIYEKELDEFNSSKSKRMKELAIVKENIENHPFITSFNQANIEFEEIRTVFDQIQSIDYKFSRFLEHLN